MNLGLWVVQILVGALFTMAGVMKLSQPVDKLAARMTWVPRVPVAQVRFIGACELAGGLGLILPWATHVAPVLTPVAGAALALVMVLAAVHHLRHDEAKMVPMNLVLGGLAAFVAWGRF